MKVGRFSYITPLALTAVVVLTLISFYEWVDQILWPDITREQQQFHVHLFITSLCCIAAFFITRYLKTRSVMASIVESSEDGIFSEDLDGKIMSWNAGAQQLYGYSPEEVKGRPISILMPPDMPDEMPDILDKINKGERIEQFETVHARKVGELIHVSLTVSPIRRPGGKILGASTIVRDITERKQIEEELRKAKDTLELEVQNRTAELVLANTHLQREMEERKRAEEILRESEMQYRVLSQEFHTILDAISDTLVLISPDMKVLWSNNKNAYQLNDTHSDQTVEHCHEMFYFRSNPCEDCPVERSFATGQLETQVSSSNGSFLEKKAFPIKEGNKVNSVILLVSDITQKMTMQAEAMHASHLASLGELAAGVAHEINNPINGVINYGQVLINECNTDGLASDIGTRIVKEGERIAGIVKSLLSFARGGREDKQSVDVGTVLRESLILTQAQIRKEGIRLDIRLPEDLPEVCVNFQEIQQVFLNIINNARYALNEKYPTRHGNKVIEVIAKRMTMDAREHVRISFCDRGVGIAANKLSMLTKPFYSTKPFGMGTGVGLAITQRIITDHGGQLGFESVEREFTRVNVDLPVRRLEGGENSDR